MNGHGHVTPNADGSRARCGGPGFCPQCNAEAGALWAVHKNRIAALEADLVKVRAELAQARVEVDSACRRMFEAQKDRLSFEVRMVGALKERDEAQAECERLRREVMILAGMNADAIDAALAEGKK